MNRAQVTRHHRNASLESFEQPERFGLIVTAP